MKIQVCDTCGFCFKVQFKAKNYKLVVNRIMHPRMTGDV